MKLNSGLIFCLLCFSLGCTQQKESASSQSIPANTQITTATSNFNAMRWPSSSFSGAGISLVVGDDLSNEFAPADYISGLSPAEQMQNAWNESMSSKTFFSLPASTTSNKEYSDLGDYYDNEFGIYRHSTWFDNVSSSALAITQFFGIRKNTGTSSEYLEFVHADIIMNFRDFDFSTDSSDPTTYDIHSVLLHEVGHFLGLVHQSSTASSVMRPYLDIAGNERELYSLDKDTISYIYNNFGVSSLESDLDSGTSITVGAIARPTVQIERGVIELHADGTCHHYLNNKLQKVHRSSF